MPGHPTASRRALLRAIAAALLARATRAAGTRAASDATPVPAIPADLAAALPDAATLADLGLVETRRAGVATIDAAAIGRLLPSTDPLRDAWRAGAVLAAAPASADARFTSAGLALDTWPDAATAAAVATTVAETFALTAVHLPDHASVRDTLPGVTSAAYIDAETEHIEVLVVGYVASHTLVGWVAGGLDCDPRPASYLVRAAYNRLAA